MDSSRLGIRSILTNTLRSDEATGSPLREYETVEVNKDLFDKEAKDEPVCR
jgi:hypothetical protein